MPTDKSSFAYQLGRFLRNPAGKLTVAIGVAGVLTAFALAQYGAARGKQQAAARQEREKREMNVELEQNRRRESEALASALSEVPAKVSGWRRDLAALRNPDSIEALNASVHQVDAIESSVRECLRTLGTEVPPDVQQVWNDTAELGRQFRNEQAVVNGAANAESGIQRAQKLAAAGDWLAADSAYAEVLSTLEIVDSSPRELKRLIPSSFNAKGLRAQASTQRAAIAGRVASVRREAAYLASCGEAPAIGYGDGALMGLEAFIRKTAHDPDSIDVENCAPPALTSQECWVSSCGMRGKNAFGALVFSRIRVTYSMAAGYAIKRL